MKIPPGPGREFGVVKKADGKWLAVITFRNPGQVDSDDMFRAFDVERDAWEWLTHKLFDAVVRLEAETARLKRSIE